MLFKKEKIMKSLKPWQKWVLRLINEPVRSITCGVLFLIMAISWSLTLMIAAGPSEFWRLAKQAAAGDLIVRIMLSHYSPYWLIPLSILSLFLFFKFLNLMDKKDLLPEVSAQKVQAFIKDNPEFTDILVPLVQDAIVTDDGRRLAEKIRKIRDLLRLKERLAYRRANLADLENEIAKQEKELMRQGEK